MALTPPGSQPRSPSGEKGEDRRRGTRAPKSQVAYPLWDNPPDTFLWDHAMSVHPLAGLSPSFTLGDACFVCQFCGQHVSATKAGLLDKQTLPAPARPPWALVTRAVSKPRALVPPHPSLPFLPRVQQEHRS